MFSAPLTAPRAISGTVISASGSSAGVPGTVFDRGSRCAWLTSCGSRWSIAQPVIPSPRSGRPLMISSAQLSRAITGMSTRRASSAW